jgi:sulfopyruvate decarboxylase TPP-binding subunit
MGNLEVKEFWNHLCEDLGYRFFSGVACKGLKSLYDNMDPGIMHYVPAVNERVALGIVNGVSMSGDKCAILINIKYISDLYNILEFNADYKVPILFIVYGDSVAVKNSPIKFFNLNFNTFRNDLNRLERTTILKGKPGMIVINKGVL